MRALPLSVCFVLIGCDPTEAPKIALDPPPLCSADAVPDAATRRFGVQEDGSFVGMGGRTITPAGPSTIVEGMPGDLRLHPSGPWAYVTSASRDDQDLLVLDVDTGEVLQRLERDEAFHGLQISADGTTLYASGGDTGRVEVYLVGDDGLLTEDGEITVGGWASGIALSANTLWVGQLLVGRIDEVDLETRTVTRSMELSSNVWEVVYVPGREELWLGMLADDHLAVVDLASGAQVAEIPALLSPAGLTAAPDGGTVWAALSDDDLLVAFDTTTRQVVASAPAADDLLAPDGSILPHSNPNSVWLDPATDRLFTTRGADNMVDVWTASTLERLGTIPTAFYPTAVELAADGHTLVVTEAKGGGVGAGGDAKEQQKGTVTVIDLDGLDLVATTAEAAAQFSSPLTRFPWPCDAGDSFPVPEAYDGGSPIEHMVLIVKENKTFDCYFGDMGDELEVDADPAYLEWTAEIVPNQRQLARDFVISDNFFMESNESDYGHVILTTAHWTEYAERLAWEWDRNGGGVGWQVSGPAETKQGNFFSHVVDHDRTLTVYGEIVGLGAPTADGGQVFDHADLDYPGGPAVNYFVRDADKAAYVNSEIARAGLSNFTYISLPNDHTVSTGEGNPTPESMVADNDHAVGLIVEAISQDAELWEKTVIFILQDDPQGCGDHVDAHRGFLLAAGGYVKRGGYVSHVNASYFSVFATIERLLGIPPFGRPDAAAAPVWDFFTSTADTSPWTSVDRIPEEVNPPDAIGGILSLDLDFTSADRAPAMNPILNLHRAWKMGRITRIEAERRLLEERFGVEEETWEELNEEAEEETYAFDEAWVRYQAWRASRGLDPTPLPGAGVTR